MGCHLSTLYLDNVYQPWLYSRLKDFFFLNDQWLRHCSLQLNQNLWGVRTQISVFFFKNSSGDAKVQPELRRSADIGDHPI